MVIYFNAGFFGELIKQVFIDIIAPIEHIDGYLAAVATTGGTERQGKDKDKEYCKLFFHFMKSSIRFVLF